MAVRPLLADFGLSGRPEDIVDAVNAGADELFHARGLAEQVVMDDAGGIDADELFLSEECILAVALARDLLAELVADRVDHIGQKPLVCVFSGLDLSVDQHGRDQKAARGEVEDVLGQLPDVAAVTAAGSSLHGIIVAVELRQHCIVALEEWLYLLCDHLRKVRLEIIAVGYLRDMHLPVLPAVPLVVLLRQAHHVRPALPQLFNDRMDCRLIELQMDHVALAEGLCERQILYANIRVGVLAQHLLLALLPVVGYRHHLAAAALCLADDQCLVAPVQAIDQLVQKHCAVLVRVWLVIPQPVLPLADLLAAGKGSKITSADGVGYHVDTHVVGKPAQRVVRRSVEKFPAGDFPPGWVIVTPGDPVQKFFKGHLLTPLRLKNIGRWTQGESLYPSAQLPFRRASSRRAICDFFGQLENDYLAFRPAVDFHIDPAPQRVIDRCDRRRIEPWRFPVRHRHHLTVGSPPSVPVPEPRCRARPRSTSPRRTP